MTSSDVLDTGLALAIQRSGELLLAEQAALTATLRDLALRHADTLCVGRTHGIHAEPTTFGLKLAGHALESRRNEERLAEAIARRVGRQALGRRRHLRHARPGDRGATCWPSSASAGSRWRPRWSPATATPSWCARWPSPRAALDRLATELRHLQRTELREAEEAFTVGQKGSSAMPHKRNPITAERISGIARVVRGHAVAALEDVALWHERDISHSSVERIILPDAFLALDYMLARTPHPDGGPGRAARPDARRARQSRTAWSSRSACCSAWSSAASPARRPTRWCSATRCAPGTRAGRWASCWPTTPR